MARHKMLASDPGLAGLSGFGSGLNSIWGAVIGGGSAGVAAIIAGHASAKLAPYRELIGLGAGLSVAGVLYAMKSTRHAALGAAVGAFLAAGMALLEKHLLGAVTVTPVMTTPTAPTGTAGIGMPSLRALNGLGMPSIRSLNGLGIPAVSPVNHPVGTIPGVAGNQLAHPGLSAPPVSLLGVATPQSAQLLGMGGPQVHGLSAAYGATLLGQGR